MANGVLSEPSRVSGFCLLPSSQVRVSDLEGMSAGAKRRTVGSEGRGPVV